MKEFMKAWNINEKQFPHDGSLEEQLAFCVRYAILAPSPYNTQPWFFKISKQTITINIDRRYGLPVIDPDDREMIMCCAASLFALKLALKHFGFSVTTELIPDENDKDLLAKVKVSEEKRKIEENEASEEEKLFEAIARRHTNRGAFADKEIPEDLLRSLKSAASAEGAWLHICSVHEKQMIVNMIEEADHIQTGNKHFRRELASWVDQRRMNSGDGMPEIGLTHNEIMTSFSPSIARRFEGEDSKPADNAQLAEGSPVIAVLGTLSGGSVERIHAGQALMRVFLEAEANGLAISTLNQPCEVPELRLRLHDELDHQGRAHMIIRIGYGGKPVYTPRRPLSSVLEIEGQTFFDSDRKAANDGGNKGLLKKVRKLFKK
jgi:hypothetical protein